MDLVRIMRGRGANTQVFAFRACKHHRIGVCFELDSIGDLSTFEDSYNTVYSFGIGNPYRPLGV
jgi:hypothetical protein